MGTLEEGFESSDGIDKQIRELAGEVGQFFVCFFAGIVLSALAIISGDSVVTLGDVTATLIALFASLAFFIYASFCSVRVVKQGINLLGVLLGK